MTLRDQIATHPFQQNVRQRQLSAPVTPLQEDHRIHVVTPVKANDKSTRKLKDCVVCRFHDCRHQTIYRCVDCDPSNPIPVCNKARRDNVKTCFMLLHEPPYANMFTTTGSGNGNKRRRRKSNRNLSFSSPTLINFLYLYRGLFH